MFWIGKLELCVWYVVTGPPPEIFLPVRIEIEQEQKTTKHFFVTIWRPTILVWGGTSSGVLTISLAWILGSGSGYFVGLMLFGRSGESGVEVGWTTTTRVRCALSVLETCMGVTFV